MPRKSFNLSRFLGSAGADRRIVRCPRDAVIYAQGDNADEVFYLQQGEVKISVASTRGKEAILTVVAAGDFFGEACLAGQDRRMASATALTSSTMLVMQGGPLRAMVRAHVALAERLLVHTLTRNIRIEDDLVDQLFNSCEKRLARALLLLAHHGKKDEQLLLGHVSQRTLAQMVGSTRSRVNFFMNRFRELGFLEYNGTILVNRSLLTVLAHDSRKPPSSSVSH